MNRRLEEKLAEYEKNAPITNDAELLASLNEIIDEQTRLAPEEMDTDLLSEAVDLALSLEGEDLSELAEFSRSFGEKHMVAVRKKKAKAPVLLSLGRRGIAVAAAVALILMTSVIGFTAGFDWLGELYMRIVSEDNKELIAASISKEYDDLSDMVREFELKGVLLPYDLPVGLSYKRIIAQRAHSKPIEGDELFSYSIFDIAIIGEGTYQEVYIESENLGSTAEGERKTLGGREVTYFVDGVRHFAFFACDGYTYTVSASEFYELEALITALK